MKRKTIYIIICVILILALIVYLLNKIPRREFKTFEFPSTLVVNNFTKNERVDTLTMIIVNKLMGYDTMRIDIYPMPPNFEADIKTEYVAFIVPVPFEKHRYKIYLQKNAKLGKMKIVLPHEMVHLKQFEDGRLSIIDQYGYIWEGDTVSYSDVKYDDRPYEKEAFEISPKITRKLNKILYEPQK